MFRRKPEPDVGAEPVSQTKELHELTYDELASQKMAIDQELARRGTGELELLKTKLVSIAAALGVSIDDLFSQKKEHKQREEKAIKVRYRNPDNHDETWSGRGKPRKWLQDRIDAGASKEDFAVQ